MADSTQGEARNNGRGSGRNAQARAAALALPEPSNADASRTRPPTLAKQAQAARAAYSHARAYQLAMAYAHIRAYVSLAVKGSGLLALFLSSVILLGGFIESLDKLGKMDFWCVTAITVIQAAGIFEDWENSVENLVDFSESIMILVIELPTVTFKGIPMSLLSIPLVESFLILIACLQLIFLLGPLASAAISAWRIPKLNHGNRDGTHSMIAALNLFYSLVIFQGTMFWVLLLTVYIGKWPMTRTLCALDQLPSEKWVKTAILEYLSDISKKCRKNPLSIKGTDLIKYAVELLDSEFQADYLVGARLLSAFIKKQGEDVRSLLLPSTPKIKKLMESLRISSSLDEACLELSYSARFLGVMSNLDDKREIRELAAVIVADLAGHIDLAKYPDSMQYISSLLREETTQTHLNIKQVPYPQRPIEPLTQEEQRQDFEEMPERPIGQWRHAFERLRKRREMKAREREQRRPASKIIMIQEEKRQWTLLRDQKRMVKREGRRPKNREGDASYELILLGLTILDKLASNKDNCSLICSAPGLLPKITAPLYSGTFFQDVTVKAWSDIVTRSLKLLHKLVRAPGSTGMSLRQDISSNGQALSNLKDILNLSSEAAQELQLPAMEILTELALDLTINLDRGTKKFLITKQCEVFLDNGEGGESATIAGRTLVSLSETNSDLIVNTRKDITGRLTELLDAKNNIISRTIAAEIMENLCAHSGVDKKYMKATLLPMVLEVILSFRRESQQRNMSRGRNNSSSGDEEDKRDSNSGKGTLLTKLLKEIISFWRESQQRNMSPGQKNSASGDEENQTDSKSSGKGTLLSKVLKKIIPFRRESQQRNMSPGQNNSASGDVENQSDSEFRNDKANQNKLSDEEIEIQEAFLSLTLAICNKLNSTDDFDDTIEKNVGRKKIMDELKSIINDNSEATPDSLRIVKLCGRIAESMMQCQQYQEYADHFRKSGFESSLSRASETMSKLESWMLYIGTDFGLKKTVRPLISDIHLAHKSNLDRALQEYLAMYKGPLPAEIIAALTATFNLDDEEAEEMDVELAGMLGEGVGEPEDATEITVA